MSGPIVMNFEFIGFHETDAEKVKGCTPVILNKLHADGLRECVEEIEMSGQNPSVQTTNYQKFCSFLAIYSTEPRLLDPILPQLINSLLAIIDLKRETNSAFSLITEEAFLYLKTLCFVCHYKTVSSLLPHDVELIEPLLSALEFYTNNSTKYSSDISYGLQAWLYIVCKNPFDFARLAKEHSQVATGLDSLSQRLIACLMKIQRNYNRDTSFYRLTPNFLAQILTRNKDNSAVLRPILNETGKMFEMKSNDFVLRPQLSLLSSIFKFGKRKEMLIYADEVLKLLETFNLDGPACYFAVKLFQRLALTFLPPKLADWRYKCGYRSLEANLMARSNKENGTNHTKSSESKSINDNSDEADELMIRKSLNIINDVFLRTVQNEMNDVRMTSAKAIGRICARLSKEQTYTIIKQILVNNFDSKAPASSWHGGCLALAELSSRGCFLPDQLAGVMPLICEALLYDKQSNGNVTESNVRDAACYICWSFARAYEIDALREHCELLAQRLVCTSLFDREVNVRRAASASFQENVGRHGGFVNGIEVLVLIDFTAVGKIRHCYEVVCVEVAQFEAYRRPMLDHLRTVTCVHWDEKLRLLASTAIEKLVVFDEDYSLHTLLPYFCNELQKSNNFADMQGYLLAISAVVRGLHLRHKERFDRSDHLRSVSEFIFKNSTQMRQLVLRNVSFLIKSACVFIETIATTNMKLENNQLSAANDVLEFTTQNPIEQIRGYGERGLVSLFAYYWKLGHRQLLFDRVKKYLTEIQTATSELVASAWTIAIRCLPVDYFVENEGQMRTTELLQITSKTISEPIDSQWYNVKIEAIRTLTRLLQLASGKRTIDWNLIFESLFNCITDRTKTKQGDVGRYVRSAALNCVCSILSICEQYGELSNTRLDKTVAYVIQRCSDTVDKTRITALETVNQLLNTQLPIREKETLKSVFEYVESDVQNGVAFIKLEKLLILEPYRTFLLRGLIESMASILAWTAEHAQKLMMRYLDPIKEDEKEMEKFIDELLSIGKETDDETDILQFITAVQRLVSDGAFAIFEQNPDHSKALDSLCSYILAWSSRKTKTRLRHTCIQTLGTLMIFDYDSKIGQNVRLKLVSFLCSPYAGLRAMSADQLQEALNLANEKVYERNQVQEAIQILTETNWNDSNQRDELNLKAKRLTELLS
ncbi:Tubulin-specific chaperone D [Aphelenchoides besseyi]|nr:Tubulin-specific chaperone D [Aphelenchoides besseyi]KAI6207819.1 Tubulin-specific chaperone D [Aphelenchoides besseyi]